MSLDPAGERDWLAPQENARRMYQEAQNPQKALLIVPGAWVMGSFNLENNILDT